jgi:hypothetical protein
LRQYRHKMPASAACYLRVALLPLVLLACRTRDNPNVCKDPNECGAGMQCNLATERCEPKGGPDVGRTDGPTDSSGGQTGSDGPGAESGEDAAGACVTSANCTTADKPMCSPAGRCVACMGHGDCAADSNRPACVEGTCVPCQANLTACGEKNPAAPKCAGTGACVECVDSRDCSQVTAPICVDYKCARCTSDEQCRQRGGDSPGLCLAHLDGRCATDAEVIHVRSGMPCVDQITGPGTSDMPFCQPSQALEIVGPTRRILLLRGPDAFGPINVRPDFPGIAAGVISIIGQPGAAIAPGAHTGVTVGGGEVYLRGLTIRNGEKEGVLADGAAIVRLNQCVIRLNMKGGLRFQNGAGFEVVNTVLDSNGPGFLNDDLTPFGGAYLGAPTDGRPGVFRFNTVIRNGMVGVACARLPSGQQQLLDSVLLSENGLDEQRGCQTPHSIIAGPTNPALFDPARPFPYWLTESSPCVDQGNPTSYPPDDWKGESRPRGARSDCGADEFQKD